jgi:hypothetical protein
MTTTNDKVTLNTLLSFIPENEEEANIFNIDKTILSQYHNEVIQSLNGIYYLGGYIKLTADDEITPSKISELDKLNQYTLDNMYSCNSWEIQSVFMQGKKIKDTKLIVQKYLDICELRNKSI